MRTNFLPFVDSSYSFGGCYFLFRDSAYKDGKVSLMSYNLTHAHFFHSVQKYLQLNVGIYVKYYVEN